MSTDNLPAAIGLLNYFSKHVRPHLRSMYSAVMDNKIVTGLVVPHDDAFQFKGDLPFVVSISDDIGKSFGPEGFNQQTLTPLMKQCRAAVIITVWLQSTFYDEAVAFAVNEQANVAVIETNMSHEGRWLQFITEINPEIWLALWSTNQQGLA